MKPSQVLREAARRIERGLSFLGCNAIARSCKFCDRPAAQAYFNLVSPGQMNSWEVWFGNTHPDNQNRRVVALCLAAAIAESEGS